MLTLNKAKSIGMQTCPICGCVQKEKMGTGDICNCCGNELGFDDVHTKEETISYFCRNNIQILYDIAPEAKEYEMNEYLPRTTLQKFLRLNWIKNKYKRKYMNKIFWNSKKAIKQLENIGIDVDEQMKKKALDVTCYKI